MEEKCYYGLSRKYATLVLDFFRTPTPVSRLVTLACTHTLKLYVRFERDPPPTYYAYVYFLQSLQQTFRHYRLH